MPEDVKSNISDNVIMGDFTQIANKIESPLRVTCESCHATGNFAIFVCNDTNCTNKFCEHCKDSVHPKKCTICVKEMAAAIARPPPPSVVVSQPAVDIGAQMGMPVNVITGPMPPDVQHLNRIVEEQKQQYKQQKTPATTALVLAILAILILFTLGPGICFAIPGLIIANQALAITGQIPGHPDAGRAKAAQVISWFVIGLTIAAIVLGFFFVLLISGM